MYVFYICISRHILKFWKFSKLNLWETLISKVHRNIFNISVEKFSEQHNTFITVPSNAVFKKLLCLNGLSNRFEPS